MPANRPLYDVLNAYDAALAAINSGDRSPDVRKQAVLALARGGATETALRTYKKFRLDHLTEDEDALSLKGRLLKDLAESEADYTEAAIAYQRAHILTGGTYSGINAATLFILGGDPAQGAALAKAVLQAELPEAERGDGEASYYAYATQAEALLLLGDVAAARETLGHAMRCDPENYTAHATTLRQFEKILLARGEQSHWLDNYRPPQVAFYAGRIQSLSETRTDAANDLEQRIRLELADARISTAYGALAAGGDILLAEALLEDGVGLNVVLPCDAETFETHSVAPFGADWRKRFQTCLSLAETVTIATNDTTLMGQTAIELGAEIAMGRALQRADELATSALQIFLTPKRSDMIERFEALWRNARAGQETLYIANGWTGDTQTEPDTPPLPKPQNHQLAAMIFADLKGYSELSDAQVANVVSHILAPLSDILNRDIPPIYVNSWGDGIFAIYRQVSDAAGTALNLQELMRSIDKSALGLPDHLDLRIGGHYGPVALIPDPVTRRPGAYGSQVSYAARIEPLAVPGSILVSEAFAARLVLSADDGISPAYVGMRKLRPNGPDVRLFALRPQTSSAKTL